MKKSLTNISRLLMVFFILTSAVVIYGSYNEQKTARVIKEQKIQQLSQLNAPPDALNSPIPSTSPTTSPSPLPTTTDFSQQIQKPLPTSTPLLNNTPLPTPTLQPTQPPTPSPSPTPKIITLKDQVPQHNTVNDCWMIIDNKVYDITSYFGMHPGGNSAMEKFCGKDGTNGFITKDKSNPSDHSPNAYKLLERYRIDM